jgi:hypothetical protein
VFDVSETKMGTKMNEEGFRVTLHLHSTQCHVRGAPGCLDCDFQTPSRPKSPVFEGFREGKKVGESVYCLCV